MVSSTTILPSSAAAAVDQLQHWWFRRRHRRPESSSFFHAATPTRIRQLHEDLLLRVVYKKVHTKEKEEEEKETPTSSSSNNNDPRAMAACEQRDHRTTERALVETIREIGTVVVQSQPPPNNNVYDWVLLRSDPVFEYFCDSAMLPLLIDIAVATATASTYAATATEHSFPRGAMVVVTVGSGSNSLAVMNQVVETMTFLLSSLRHESALYYMLSQNAINRLIIGVLCMCSTPTILPCVLVLTTPFVDLLKTLTLHLVASPHLFPCFLMMQSQTSSVTTIATARTTLMDPHHGNDDETMPLLTALVETALLGYRQSDSFIHATCLRLLVSLLRIPPVHAWVSSVSISISSSSSSSPPHRVLLSTRLAEHLALILTDRFERLVTLTQGPVVHAARSTALHHQLAHGGGGGGGWNHHVTVVNDLFFVLCNRHDECHHGHGHGHVHAWTVRICETILQQFVVDTLLTALRGYNNSRRTSSCSSRNSIRRSRLLRRGGSADVGVMDVDVIPEPEARAQVATLMVKWLLDRLAYAPLVRMLAVAVLHPYSINDDDIDDIDDCADEHEHENEKDASNTPQPKYSIIPLLNSIVQDYSVQQQQQQRPENVAADTAAAPPPPPPPAQKSNRRNIIIENGSRLELFAALRGEYGAYRFVPTAWLMETALATLDRATIDVLDLVPPVQEALSVFLQAQQPQPPPLKSQLSSVSSVAGRAAASLAVHLLYYTIITTNKNTNTTPTNKGTHPIHRALQGARDYFYTKALEASSMAGVSDLFVDLVESVAVEYYTRTKTTSTTLPLPQPVTTTTTGSTRVAHNAVSSSSEVQVYAFHLSRHSSTSFRTFSSNHSHSTHQHPHSLIPPLSEALVRKMRGASYTNNVEAARFFVEMAIFYRACCRIVDRWFTDSSSSSSSSVIPVDDPPPDTMRMRLEDPADEWAHIFHSLSSSGAGHSYDPGTDLDLRGRTVFACSPPPPRNNNDDDCRRSTTTTFPTTTTARASSRNRRTPPQLQPKAPPPLLLFLLVLDPREMLLVRPTTTNHPHHHNDGISSSRSRTTMTTIPTRGRVLCSVPLLHIIAAVADQEWLHVAVKKSPQQPQSLSSMSSTFPHSPFPWAMNNVNAHAVDDPPFLSIQNNTHTHTHTTLNGSNDNHPTGNHHWTLQLDSASTCRIVHHYLEHCRQVVRAQAFQHIQALFRVIVVEDDDDDVNKKKEKKEAQKQKQKSNDEKEENSIQ